MLTDIQEKLLEMMKEIDAICQEADIHYTLGGGTAIGAIRHGGFIPWDDDIDLYMTRSNWEKFKQAYREGKFPENRRLESAETDLEYSNTFARYVTTDTTAIHSHQIITNDPAGHVLDIFVFDPIHIDNFWKFMEDFQLYSDLMNETMGYSARFDMNIKRYPEYYKRTRLEGRKKAIDELIESFTHLDSPGWEHYVMEWGTAPFLFPASIFNMGYIRVPFEDTTVEIVRNYTEYLTWQYGDEWQYIPKHEGREGHDAIFSSKYDYQTVRNDYLPFIDKEKLHEAYIRRKKRLIFTNRFRRKAQVDNLKAAGEKVKQSLLADIEKRGLDVSALRKKLENFEYKELSEIFSDYYDKQLSAEFIGRKDKHSTLHRYYNPVTIDLDDELLEIAIETLLRTERMSKAKRLIDVYKNLRLQKLDDEIIIARKIIYAYAVADNEKIYKSVSDFVKKYPYNSQIRRIKVRMILENPELEENPVEEASKQLKLLTRLCNRDSVVWSELLKYGYDVERLKRNEKGLLADEVRKYIELYKRTENGCIKKEIEELFSELGAFIDKDEGESKSVVLIRKNEDYAKPHSPYAVARDAYRKIAERDDKAKERAWQIACRTKDRMELLERYEDRIPALKELVNNSEWSALEIEMEAHQEAVMRNLEAGLGLCVHPELREIQNVLFIKQGKKDVMQRVESLIPEQHKKPIGR